MGGPEVNTLTHSIGSLITLSLMFIRSNIFSESILDQPEFVEVRSRLGFRE